MTQHSTSGRQNRPTVGVPQSFLVRRRRAVLIVTSIVVGVAALIGANVAKTLSVGGFVADSSEYEQGRRFLAGLGGGTSNYVLLVTARGAPSNGPVAAGEGAIEQPAIKAVGEALTAELRRQPEILDAGSFWTLGQPLPLRSGDGTEALVLGLIAGDEDAVRHATERLTPLFTRSTDLVDVRVGGAGEVSRQVGVQAEHDLRKAELLAAPFTFVALLFVFGGIAAAFLPLGVALVSVLTTFAALRILTEFTDVSIFALNLTTALGLGLAIDYSLFVLSRYREERLAGADLDLALRRTMQTAGRTVGFSAATVAVSLSALMIFPMAYLRSYAYAGIIVVSLAAVSTLTVLPALLAVLGDRVLPRKVRTHRSAGVWGRQARRVMRRPVVVTIAVTAVLLILGAPFLHLRFGLIDDRVIPARLSSRAVDDEIRAKFTTLEADAIAVVVPGLPGDADESKPEIRKIAKQLALLDNVNRVDSVVGHYLYESLSSPDATTKRFRTSGSTWLSIVPSDIAISSKSEAIVRAIRATDLGRPVLVTGPTARFVDTKDAVTRRLPYALGIIALVTFVVLFALLGSVIVPLKATLMNFLSLTAAFGAMVWVFQDGHLASWFDVTATGAIDVFTPILMFCVAFGLSMDYEVFLLSRIKEDYDLTGDNTHAIAAGLDKTGRLVTSAAGLLAIVFLTFMTSAVSVVKLLGLGLTLAVLVDAFVIRATLVPAVMRLAGRTNWWAPRQLKWLHLRFGIWEREPSEEMDRLRAASVAHPHPAPEAGS